MQLYLNDSSPADELRSSMSLFVASMIFVFGLILPARLRAITVAPSVHRERSTGLAAMPGTKSRALASLATLPLAFEPNQGQTDPAVKYVVHGSQYTLFLTASEAVFAMPTRRQVDPGVKAGAIAPNPNAKQSTWTSIRMRMPGASTTSAFIATGRLPGRKNYFIGTDKSKWVSGVPFYSRVESHDVYHGIDVAYRSNAEKRLEFDFLVTAGANPRQIKLAFDGVLEVKAEPSGGVLLHSAAGDLRLDRPVAYQEARDGARKPVDVRFVKEGRNQVRMALGPYDRRRKLTIDPSVTYATYLGGTDQDEGLGVATDSNGDTYVTGGTDSPNFPTTEGSTLVGGFDIFVTELDPNGQLIFSTLIGGSADDVGTSIAVSDGSIQAIYVTGWTDSPDLPLSGTSYFYEAGKDAFLLELTLDGSAQLGGTYLPGDQDDIGTAVTFDGTGNAIVVGQTFSDDFVFQVTSVNSLPGESQINLGNGTGPSDGFIVWVAGQGTFVYFSSYLGGTASDLATGVAIDNPGSPNYNIYISGGTNSPDFPFTNPNVVQPRCGTDGSCNGGQDDAFVTEVNETAVVFTPVYSTYLGGSGKDDALSIAADSASNAYVTGQTASPDFKLASPYQATLNGTQNAFVSKLNPTGTALVFSTYLGGSGSDAGLGLAIDGSNNIYITGRTTSTDFPLQFPTQSTIGGGNDAFVSVLNPSGSTLTFSTFLGGSGDEDVIGGAIAVDATQNVYVTGDTNSTNFPVVNPSQRAIGSTDMCLINGQQVLCPDAFVAKINAQPPGNSTLTIAFGPDGGGGLVTSSPTGIDCATSGSPSDCSSSFVDGTLVTLAETTFDSQFGGWSGPGTGLCGTNPTCQINITTNETVTADFIPAASGILSVSLIGMGTGTVTSTPPGINCPGSSCSGTFVVGSQVTLTANPDSDSYFSSWTSSPVLTGCSGTGACTFTMPSGNPSVQALFNLNNGPPPPQSDFTLTVSPINLGVVQVGNAGVAGISLVALNNFNDTVNLTCSVQPASTSAPSCTIDPTSVAIPINGGGSATATINTTGLGIASAKPFVRHPGRSVLALCLPFLGVGFLYPTGSWRPTRRNQKLTKGLPLILVLVAMTFYIACGSSGSGSHGTQGGQAQPGNYTVTITGSAASSPIIHTAQLSITVQ
jgi:hypothetical protein